MAANKIHVSANEMESYATKLQYLREELESILKNLDDCMSRLSEEWVGDSFEGYQEQYVEISTRFQQLLDYIDSFKEAVVTTANNFKEIDASLAKSIRGYL